MPEIIDAARAMTLLEQVVAGREQFVYYVPMSCRYFDNGKPSCIVGHVLVGAGFVPKNVPLHWNTDSIRSTSMIVGLAGEGFHLTPKAKEILASAQYVQDSADGPSDSLHSWGCALAAARYTFLHNNLSDKIN